MPELPEVESVRIGLSQLVTDAKIQSISVNWDRIIHPSVSPQEFQDLLVGQTFRSFSRRGKYLILGLDDYAILSHLRMEGKYEVHPQTDPWTKHTHVVFHLEDGRDLRYLDVRKFGRMTLIPLKEVDQVVAGLGLGPEPFEETFDLEDFKQALTKRTTPIKPLLLGQKVVAGVGNIYADEILFQAQIHPARLTNSLSEPEVTALHAAILDVMDKAVQAGGSTIRTYQNALGEAGKFQQSLKVYGQTGKPCPRCGHDIVKIQFAQRGTHFCPHCQRL